jgi:hypothetical protein
VPTGLNSLSTVAPLNNSHPHKGTLEVGTNDTSQHVPATHHDLVHSCSKLHQSPHNLHMPVVAGDKQRGRAIRLLTQSQQSTVCTPNPSHLLDTLKPLFITLTARSTFTPMHTSNHTATARPTYHSSRHSANRTQFPFYRSAPQQ